MGTLPLLPWLMTKADYNVRLKALEENSRTAFPGSFTAVNHIAMPVTVRISGIAFDLNMSSICFESERFFVAAYWPG
jgi:hypothetical protein